MSLAAIFNTAIIIISVLVLGLIIVRVTRHVNNMFAVNRGKA